MAPTKTNPFLTFLIGALLVFSLGLIFIGLSVPALKVTMWFVLTREYSLFGGIMSLFENGQTLLGIIVFTFTVVFPIGKIILGLTSIMSLEKHPRRTPACYQSHQLFVQMVNG